MRKPCTGEPIQGCVVLSVVLPGDPLVPRGAVRYDLQDSFAQSGVVNSSDLTVIAPGVEALDEDNVLVGGIFALRLDVGDNHSDGRLLLGVGPLELQNNRFVPKRNLGTSGAHRLM